MKNNRYSYLFLVIITVFFVTNTATAEMDKHKLGPVKSLIVGVNKDLSPYEFINEAGEPDGYTVDLITAVAEVLGLEISFVLDDWHILRDDLAAKRLDVVSGMLYSKERAKSFDYSIAHSTFSYSLFVRKDSPFRRIDDLKGKHLIVVDGVYAHDWLDEHKVQVTLVPVNSSTRALKLLSSGKSDGAILPRLHALNLVKELQLSNVEIIGPAVLEQKFGFAVADGNSDILALLNDGLFTLQMNGKYEEIYLKWFSVEEKTRTLEKVLKYLIPTAILIVVLFFMFITWNRILKRTVARKTAEIEQNRQSLHQILEGIPVPTFVVNCHGLVIHWNKACEVLTGHPARSVLGTKDYEQVLYPDQTTSIGELLLTNRLNKEKHQYKGVNYRRSRLLKEAYETELYFENLGIDGQWFYVSAAIIRDGAGEKLGVVESWQDLTEAKLLERQLIQSQKMEALGTLAGGVAHDFNNILTSIIGTTELASCQLDNGPKLQKYLEVILAGGRRGRDLTSQILAFSSKATIRPQSVSVTSVAEEAVALLKSIRPKNIKITSQIMATKEVIVDPTHIHQVIMNICTNAVHSMRESGGVLDLSLENFTMEQVSPLFPKLAPGEYIRLIVADNGSGMEDSVYKRIFDPFFTTKKRGEGTGMGLSVSAGIVKQYGGLITCTTLPGEGTTFQVYLPVGAERMK